MSYFIATCKYEKMQENGTVKRVSEKYLCEALSIVEADAVVTENLKPYISGDFFTSKVENSPIAEVMGDKEADKFYLAKVAFITIDETDRDKNLLTSILIGANDFNEAYNKLKTELKDSVSDYEIVAISKSPITEYFSSEHQWND